MIHLETSDLATSIFGCRVRVYVKISFAITRPVVAPGRRAGETG
jgi:hypothetical protein